MRVSGGALAGFAKGRLLADICAAACGLAATGVVVAGVHDAVTHVLVLVALTVGLGWAVTGWIPLNGDGALLASVVLAASVVLPIVTGLIMVEMSLWYPVSVGIGLMMAGSGTCLVRVAVHLVAASGPR